MVSRRSKPDGEQLRQQLGGGASRGRSFIGAEGLRSHQVKGMSLLMAQKAGWSGSHLEQFWERFNTALLLFMKYPHPRLDMEH